VLDVVNDHQMPKKQLKWDQEKQNSNSTLSQIKTLASTVGNGLEALHNPSGIRMN